MRRVATQLAVAIGMITHASLCGAVDLDRQIQFEIPAQKLDAALMEFSRQAKIQIVASTPNLSDYQTTGAKGTLTIGEALGRLLGDSGLAIKEVGEETLAIVASKSEVATTTSVVDTNAMVRVASVSTQREGPVPASSTPQDATSVPKKIELEEVVVTGSHIRGAQNLSAPVIRFDREDIERSGYSTTQQFIQTIPQNFGNIVDDGFQRFGGRGDGLDGVGAGSGVNLRGIGAASTLVLLNGRRLAPAGVGNYVDVSLIPLGAIERIEVLTDGASALYGSDAVGGVVNFHLRKDFEGAETRVHYGTVTEGSHSEVGASQAIGHAWDSGHALVSYDYFDRDVLHSSERDFTPMGVGAMGGADLIPRQRRQGVFATASQLLTERTRLAADLFWGERDTRTDWSYDGMLSRAEGGVEQIGGSLSAMTELAGTWQLRATGSVDHSETTDITTVEEDDYRTSQENEAGLWSVDIAADGSIGTITGGQIKLALGGQIRSEEYQSQTSWSSLQIDREISAAYAELLVPFVGQVNRMQGMERLELSLAGRYEDYSDFGSTFNPKLGLAWSPLPDLNLRGTWGTSFKAPTLFQLDPSNFSPFAYQDLFVDAGGTTTTIMIGGYTSLEPEEATTWTAGFDWTPAAIPQLSLSATYFDIDYEQRISSPFPAGYSPFSVLMDSNMSFVVTRNPDRAYIEGLMAHPDFGCYCATPLTVEEIGAVVDNRTTNIAAYRTSGVDFAVGYRLPTELGLWSFALSGARLIEAYEQVVSRIPAVRASGVVNRPTKLRMRGSVAFARGPVNGSAFVNYGDSYLDPRDPNFAGPGQRSTVGSWTTVDLTLSYSLATLARGAVRDASVTLSATNLFDKDPPFVSNVYGMFFDGANATPLGRFIGVNLVARW